MLAELDAELDTLRRLRRTTLEQLHRMQVPHGAPGGAPSSRGPPHYHAPAPAQIEEIALRRMADELDVAPLQPSIPASRPRWGMSSADVTSDGHRLDREAEALNALPLVLTRVARPDAATSDTVMSGSTTPAAATLPPSSVDTDDAAAVAAAAAAAEAELHEIVAREWHDSNSDASFSDSFDSMGVVDDHGLGESRSTDGTP